MNKKIHTSLLSSLRNKQKYLENFVYKKIALNTFNSSLRKTKHFREWFKVPMDYCRIMETPLTWELLELDEVDKSKKILDIASPKLLPLYLALEGYDIIATDLEEYFLDDFDVFSKQFDISLKTKCFDATNIPYNDECFDQIFSISAFEHIPDSGDIQAVKEVARILKQGGVFVMTLPAYQHYLEEWLKGQLPYWQSVTRDDGSVFFQRRYTEADIKERFNNLGLTIEEIVWIAEKPINPPKLNENGRLDHNVYYIKALPQFRLVNKFFKYIPLAPYQIYNLYSHKTHYLTNSFDDDNIRQVAFKMRKP